MIIRRAVLLPSLAVAVLASAGLAAQPRDYRKELRDAQAQQQRRRYRDCIALCDKMLDYHKEAWQIKEITWLRIENQILDSQFEAASKALASLAKAHPDDKALQTAVALRTGDVQRQLKQFDQAVATWRETAQVAGAQEPDKAADALLRAGQVLAADLQRPEQAIALYQEIQAKLGEQRPKEAAEAARRVAEAHETGTKDLAKAAAAYLALTEKHAAAFDEGTRAGFYRKAVDCLLRAEKPAEAAAVATKAEASLESAAHKASFGIRQADLLMGSKDFAKARAAYQRVICAYPLEQGSCQHAQGKVAEAYRAESKWHESLGAARILYDAAGTEQAIRTAAQVVAQAFLAADANLVRANEFLAFQRFGPHGPDGRPDTADDIAANHLANVQYPALDAATNERFQAAIGARPRNYEGYRAKAYLYVYWGKPKEAATHFRLAFKAADLAQVPAAAQELVLVGMKAHTASFRGLDRVFEYINHGPKGKSGEENIPDPFEGL
jgi:tetratricopeptide (TPR) repeat protein